MIVVTGGAGFIGSALVHSLNQKGFEDIWVVDEVDHLEKQKNLDALIYSRWVGRDIFLKEVIGSELPMCSAILHMGACSSTTETNEAYLRENNFEYTRSLAQYCLKKDVRLFMPPAPQLMGRERMGILMTNPDWKRWPLSIFMGPASSGSTCGPNRREC